MLEPPDFVTADEVLDVVRTHWAIDVDVIEHLPVGFGAHHWRVSSAGEPRLFVTLDSLGPRHTAESLEAAYSAAAELSAAGLEFVVASVPNRNGRYTAPLAGGAVSCVPWMEGESPSSIDSDTGSAAWPGTTLRRSPGCTPRPLPPASRPGNRGSEKTSATSWPTCLRTPWQTGPYGELARAALTPRIDAIRRWTNAYYELSRLATELPWVPTHGEPHTANQLVTGQGIVFVDWESLALAPRERDLGTLVGSGYAELVAPNWEMIELFDLEWRLGELTEYAGWFARPHTGTDSDRTAFDDLMTELERPDWKHPTG